MSNRTQFSFTQLEYILAVHQYGHFAKAAEACHVTQPTLSMQIHKFETDLGEVLFDRSKKPVLLTEAGKRVIDQIRVVLTEARKVEELIQQKDEKKMSGRLNIGIIPTAAPYLIPKFLKKMQLFYPTVSLNIKELQTHQILSELDSDSLDVGILALPLEQPQYYEIPLYFEPFFLLSQKKEEGLNTLGEKIGVTFLKKIFSSADNKTGEAASFPKKNLMVWLLTEGHCFRNQVIDLCAWRKNEKKQKNLAVEFEGGSLEVLKNLVAEMGGVTLLPQLAVDSLPEGTKLTPFERPIPARQMGLIYRRKHYKAHLIELLAEVIPQAIPKEVQKIRQRDLNILPVSASE